MSGITVENYYVASTGAFFEIDRVPLGFTKIFDSRSSRYYVNCNQTFLVRESDHWGERIKNCNWYLGNEKIPCGEWIAKYKKRSMRFGIIRFSDLHPLPPRVYTPAHE